jgi:hypothetical protein
MRGTLPNPPSANSLLERARAIERGLLLSPEGSILAATLNPFLAALYGYLERDAPLERVEAKIDKLSATLGNQQPPPTSYAQAARRGQAGGAQSQSLCKAPHETAKESKLVRVRIADQGEAQKLQAISTGAILANLQESIGEIPAVRSIVAIKKLPGGDILLHTDNAEAKQHLQQKIEWVTKISPAAKVHRRTFPVIVHGIPTASLMRLDGDAQVRPIKKENEKLHAGLSISRVH